MNALTYSNPLWKVEAWKNQSSCVINYQSWYLSVSELPEQFSNKFYHSFPTILLSSSVRPSAAGGSPPSPTTTPVVAAAAVCVMDEAGATYSQEDVWESTRHRFFTKIYSLYRASGRAHVLLILVDSALVVASRLVEREPLSAVFTKTAPSRLFASSLPFCL